MLSRKSDQTMHNTEAAFRSYLNIIVAISALTLDNKEIKIFDQQISHFKQKWSF